MDHSFQTCDIGIDEAEARAAQDRANGWYTLIGALVRRADGRMFAQRRSMTRKFGAGLWDNVGGHVEDGETLRQTLEREMREETEWSLKDVCKVVAIRDWHDDRGPSREYIVVCDADGDMDRPVLETGKVDQFTWVSPDDLSILQQNRSAEDQSQSAIYAHAFAVMS